MHRGGEEPRIAPAHRSHEGERRAHEDRVAADWTLPAEPTADQKNQKAKLEKLSGTAFDKAYADLMVTNHRNNIPLFERQAAKGADAELKQFASNTLPTLKEHLEMALKAQRAVGAATSTARK